MALSRIGAQGGTVLGYALASLRGRARDVSAEKAGFREIPIGQ